MVQHDRPGPKNRAWMLAAPHAPTATRSLALLAHAPLSRSCSFIIDLAVCLVLPQVLAEMAVTEPYSFRAVVETVKAKGSPQA